MQICDPKECTGCGACAAACPKDAITMRPDKLGFPYPEIDSDKCVSCHLCQKVCHIASPQPRQEPAQKIYAGWNNNADIRQDSTSGGAFTALAEAVLEEDGVVAGAAYDEDMNVRHIMVRSEDKLGQLRGSKYVQSDLTDMFNQVKGLLQEGRTVLFTGTSCQVGAIKKFLGRSSYEGKLYTMDIVCHGVGAPAVFHAYLKHLEQLGQSKLQTFRFRSKQFSWRTPSVQASFDNDAVYTKIGLIDPIFVGFNRDVYLRESCYRCPYTSMERVSDLTISDFWGYRGTAEYPDDDRGVSMLMVNSDRGRELVQKLGEKMTLVEQTAEDAKRGQPCLSSPTRRPDQRTEFEQKFSGTFDSIEYKFIEPWWNFSSLFFYRGTHSREKTRRGSIRKLFRVTDGLTLRLKLRKQFNKMAFSKYEKNSGIQTK